MDAIDGHTKSLYLKIESLNEEVVGIRNDMGAATTAVLATNEEMRKSVLALDNSFVSLAVTNDNILRLHKEDATNFQQIAIHLNALVAVPGIVEDAILPLKTHLESIIKGDYGLPLHFIIYPHSKKGLERVDPRGMFYKLLDIQFTCEISHRPSPKVYTIKATKDWVSRC